MRMKRLLDCIPYFRKKRLLRELEVETNEQYNRIVENIQQADDDEFFERMEKASELLYSAHEKEVTIKKKWF